MNTIQLPPAEASSAMQYLAVHAQRPAVADTPDVYVVVHTHVHGLTIAFTINKATGHLSAEAHRAYRPKQGDVSAETADNIRHRILLTQQQKQMSRAMHVIHNHVTGAPLRRGFCPITNVNKIANGHATYNHGFDKAAIEALTILHSPDRARTILGAPNLSYHEVQHLHFTLWLDYVVSKQEQKNDMQT